MPCFGKSKTLGSNEDLKPKPKPKASENNGRLANGSVATGSSSKPENDKKKKSEKDIEKKLKEDKKAIMQTYRIPVVGAGESGKSTLIKQMQILYINGFSDKERLAMVRDIQRNVRDSMLSITGAMKRIDPPIDLQHPENDSLIEYIQTETTGESFSFDEKFFDNCTKLWEDEGVKACFARSNEYQLIDSAKYFLDKIADVREPNFNPCDQDILRCRVLTSGIFETKFKMNKINLHMFDVGGQRDERRKWIQVFHDITAVIFVSASSAYDMTLREDPTKNRVSESLDLFGTIWQNRFLRNNSIILFLNKMDMFKEKIEKGHTKLEDYFPEYKDYPSQPVEDGEDPEFTRAKCFLKDQYFEIIDKFANDGKRRCYPHYTTAVDTENIRRVIEDCQNILQRAYLQQFGLL